MLYFFCLPKRSTKKRAPTENFGFGDTNKLKIRNSHTAARRSQTVEFLSACLHHLTFTEVSRREELFFQRALSGNFS